MNYRLPMRQKTFVLIMKFFSQFVKIVVYLQQSLNSIQEFADCVYNNLTQFCVEFCKDCMIFQNSKIEFQMLQSKVNEPQRYQNSR